mgnify:CR=1 FL=1
MVHSQTSSLDKTLFKLNSLPLNGWQKVKEFTVQSFGTQLIMVPRKHLPILFSIFFLMCTIDVALKTKLIFCRKEKQMSW